VETHGCKKGSDSFLRADPEALQKLSTVVGPSNADKGDGTKKKSFNHQKEIIRIRRQQIKFSTQGKWGYWGKKFPWSVGGCKVWAKV